MRKSTLNPDGRKTRGLPVHRCLWGGILPILFGILLLSGSPCHARSLKAIVLTDAAGLGDKGFNDVCWQGVLRAKKDFGISSQFLQSREQADYIANLSLAAQSADIVVTLGYLFSDAVREVVPRYPRVRFIHIEGDVVGPNVVSYDFNSQEGGFLAGLVAGLYSKTRKVGVVGGVDIPPVEAYVSGFRAGVMTAEKARGEPIEAVVASAGSFNDPVKGKSLAMAMIERKVDVVFRCAGNTGIGVLEAVKQTQDVFLIAEDLDQDAEIPGRVLTSTLKRMDVAVYGAVRDIVEGRFSGGHHWLGAKEGAVDITEMKYSRERFDAKDLARIRKARELLRGGTLKVPKRFGEVKDFPAPDLDTESS